MAAAPAFEVMGIVNVTPDSFSDGGEHAGEDAAVAHGLRLVDEGADVLDVGGESTRPGAEPVAVEEELRRTAGVVERLAAGTSAVLSIDTAKPAVARAALQAGARMVNDVTALRADGMAELVAESGADCCLMHMRGEPRTMQDDPRYDDVVDDVRAFLERRAADVVAAGVAPERIRLDPGIGFGKTADHNLTLLDRLDEIVALGFPVVVGLSRKGFLGRITRVRDPHARVAATVAGNVLALERGARVFRVHDVRPTREGLQVAAATLRRHV